jgi:hypothetical protein
VYSIGVIDLLLHLHFYGVLRRLGGYTLCCFLVSVVLVNIRFHPYYLTIRFVSPPSFHFAPSRTEFFPFGTTVLT